jgi:hypothetical protein
MGHDSLLKFNFSLKRKGGELTCCGRYPINGEAKVGYYHDFSPQPNASNI